MSNVRIINAYAQALYEIGLKNKIDVAMELTSLQETINSNDSLETLLFLDVFTIDEKKVVIKELIARLKITDFVANFLLFLLDERRFGLFPQIYTKIITVDDENKGFIKGVIEGPESKVPEEVKNKVIAFLSSRIGKNVQLSEEQNKKITAGYRITVGDLQLDASLENQLEQFKSKILNAD